MIARFRNARKNKCFKSCFQVPVLIFQIVYFFNINCWVIIGSQFGKILHFHICSCHGFKVADGGADLCMVMGVRPNSTQASLLALQRFQVFSACRRISRKSKCLMWTPFSFVTKLCILPPKSDSLLNVKHFRFFSPCVPHQPSLKQIFTNWVLCLSTLFNKIVLNITECEFENSSSSP